MCSPIISVSALLCESKTNTDWESTVAPLLLAASPLTTSPSNSPLSVVASPEPTGPDARGEETATAERNGQWTRLPAHTLSSSNNRSLRYNRIVSRTVQPRNEETASSTTDSPVPEAANGLTPSIAWM